MPQEERMRREGSLRRNGGHSGPPKAARVSPGARCPANGGASLAPLASRSVSAMKVAAVKSRTRGRRRDVTTRRLKTGLAAGLVLALVPAANCVAATKWFHSPTGNIQCEVASGGVNGGHAYCQTFRAPRSVTLAPDGSVRICRGERCLGNGPENAFTLRYGRSIRVGPFRCSSARSGIRCVLVRSSHGFRITAARVRRV